MSLRGTRKQVPRKAATLQNQINTLRRQVYDQRRSPEYFQLSAEVTHTTAAWKVTQWNITNEMILSTGFRDAINGDSWRNNWFDLRFMTKTRVEFCRIVVYVPLRAGQTFSPSVTDSGAIIVPDPTAFRVLYDEIVIMHSGLRVEEGRRRFIRFKNLLTLYNGHNGTLERNDVKMTIITKADSIGSAVLWNGVFCVTEK